MLAVVFLFLVGLIIFTVGAVQRSKVLKITGAVVTVCAAALFLLIVVNFS